MNLRLIWVNLDTSAILKNRLYVFMKSFGEGTQNYIKELEKRKGKGYIKTSYQLVGLNIAVILRDMEHKSLYIKLAKESNPDTLLRIAKTVAEREDVKNRGAYFMRLISSEGKKPDFKGGFKSGFKKI